MLKRFFLPALCVLVLVGCATAPAATSGDEASRLNALLDEWHLAAAKADETAYFELFAPEGVFLGTDATERWKTDAFRAWARPYFARGRAWTFEPRSRNVYVARSGSTAWFDEVLHSASYGECRGTGVLQKYGDEWKIEQYNLTIPIPNDLADEFVARIRGLQKK